MKTKNLVALAGLFLSTINPQLSTAFAQGTAFTYQGRLNDSTNAAKGPYDLRCILYTAEIGGSQRGPILTNTATLVNNGLFTATLDFGSVFDCASYWLEIAVRMNCDRAFTTLIPRQQLTSTPYAIRAAAA